MPFLDTPRRIRSSHDAIWQCLQTGLRRDEFCISLDAAVAHENWDALANDVLPDGMQDKLVACVRSAVA